MGGMSSDPVELKKLVKQLQNAQTDEDIKGILNILKREYTVNEAILRESRAGLAVGKLRSHSSKDVADQAKELVKKWKNEVDRAKGDAGLHRSGSKANVMSGKSGSTSGKAVMSGKAGSSAKPNHAGAGTKVENRTAKGDAVKTDWTGDKTRDRCMELIYDALASDSGAPSDLILSRARDIERNTLINNDGITAAYKGRIRMLLANLRDKKNPALRESIVSGDLPVLVFCKMTNEEMASEERKAADNKIKESNLFNSLGAEDQQAETEAFQCGRCKEKKCVYRQAQTRSADEPMTTFVTCTVCGNRWKFS